ncbi:MULTISPECIES: GIY-YIG nuclease family protein [Flavobacteriaceae]|nr:GIY-YIG nuclease family protein [Muricauda sp. SP22]MDC6362636.1 GIY-YIG nuclease family protein [Muricauda sp. SP22]
MPARSKGNVRTGRENDILMFFVYVLYSSKFERYYVGFTKDIARRLKEHNAGKTTSTKPFVPWKLVHEESFETLAEARKREKYLKSAAGRRWRKLHIRPRGATE